MLGYGQIHCDTKYECIHCKGIARIVIVKPAQKATEPEIEFCPFCGLSNAYPRETDIRKEGLWN